MAKRWTEADIERLLPGTIKKQGPVSIPNKGKAKSVRSKEKAALSLIVFAICKDAGLQLETEYRFHQVRQFRFDWAIPAYKIAVEYEGLQSDKSSHTSFAGYTKNCQKYNLALLDGWKILRYTAKNYAEAGSDLVFLIGQHNTTHQH